MLTCYGHEVRLTQNDLAYVGFRLAALDTLCQLEISQGPGGDDEDPFGYLVEVPLLERVAPAVQVDLLADAWRRHRDTALHQASLLDAAVVYAAFGTALLGNRSLHRRVGPAQVARITLVTSVDQTAARNDQAHWSWSPVMPRYRA